MKYIQQKIHNNLKQIPKSWEHNTVAPNHSQRSRIILEPGDTIVYPHTNREPTLLHFLIILVCPAKGRYPRLAFGMRLIRRPWRGCCFWHVADLRLLTCCTCSLMLNSGGGGAGGVADNFLDEFTTGNSANRWYMETPEKVETNIHATQKEPASLQKEMLLGLQLDMASPCCLVWLERLCRKHFGLDASRCERRGMDEPMTDCTWNMKIQITNSYFSLRSKMKIDSPRRQNTNGCTWVT